MIKFSSADKERIDCGDRISVNTSAFIWEGECNTVNSLSSRANVHGLDCQNFAGLWVRNFVGNLFAALQFKTIQYFVNRSWRREFVGNGSPRTLMIPHSVYLPSKNIWFTPFDIKIYFVFSMYSTSLLWIQMWKPKTYATISHLTTNITFDYLSLDHCMSIFSLFRKVTYTEVYRT